MKSCAAPSKSLKEESNYQKDDSALTEEEKAKSKALASVSAASALNLDAQNIEIDELSYYLRNIESSITQGAGATFRTLIIIRKANNSSYN